jgi:hypothetical protein
MQIVRSILGFVGGVVVAVALIMVFETGNFVVYKPAEAPGFDDFGKLNEWMSEFQNDPDRVCEWVKTLPLAAMIVVQAGWSVAAFVGGWVSARIAGWAYLLHAGLIGAFVLIGTIVNLHMMKTHGYTHPDWMIVLALLMPLPLSLLGGKLVAISNPPPAEPPSTAAEGAIKAGEPPVRPT